MTVANPFFAVYEFPKALDHRGRREVICENKAASSIYSTRFCCWRKVATIAKKIARHIPLWIEAKARLCKIFYQAIFHVYLLFFSKLPPNQAI